MKNKSILNTRASHQSDNLTRLITKTGGRVFDLPVMTIESMHFKPIKTNNFDTFIFLSANAVMHFFENVDCDLKYKKIIAIGPATQNALFKAGLSHATCPAIFSSDGILAMPVLQSIQHQSIALVCGDNPKPLLSEILKQRGAQVDMIFCYRRKPLHYNMNVIFPALIKQKIDIVISTSSENFSNLMQLFSAPEHREWILQKTLCVISDKMKNGALAIGFHNIIQADNATDEAIAKAIL